MQGKINLFFTYGNCPVIRELKPNRTINVLIEGLKEKLKMQSLSFFARILAKSSLAFLIITSVIMAVDIGVAKEKAERVELDGMVKDFILKDAGGTSHALYKLSEEKPATVVLFLATQCPIATDYAERIVVLVKTYDEKNVQFIGINSNKQEKIEEISEYSEKYGFEFPVLKDPENKIADYLGARRTPEVFLLDAEHVLRYAGAIDNLSLIHI